MRETGGKRRDATTPEDENGEKVDETLIGLCGGMKVRRLQRKENVEN